MKELITAREVKERAARGEKELLVTRQTIITPSARDTARDLGMKITVGELAGASDKAGQEKDSREKGRIEAIAGQVCSQVAGAAPDERLVAMVVKEVLACLGAGREPLQPVVERDSGGLRLVRGSSVVCQPFDTGKPGDTVALRDLLPIKESPRMAAGFMTMEKTHFDWELRYDEYDYIIEGTLEITINGKTYQGKAGDVFYIPSGSRITFGCPDRVKFFYVTYPANWQEV
ncbi:MAG: cupin domain-containing protein [Bacillota bacterium]